MTATSVDLQPRIPGLSAAGDGGQFARPVLSDNGTALAAAAAIPGYTRGAGTTTTLLTAEAASSVRADLTGLPANVTALDIETDNSAGFGLDPGNGQITELVLVNSVQTIVFGGDERHILQGLADYLNTRPAGEELNGWNTHGFDFPFLGVRAAMHAEHLDGWGLELTDSAVLGTYGVVGGFEQPQAATWTTPAGAVHHDVDVMLTIKNAKLRRRGQGGLKPTARAFGAEPIELDRANLHLYTDAERIGYVASDGLVTLHNRMHAEHLMAEAEATS